MNLQLTAHELVKQTAANRGKGNHHSSTHSEAQPYALRRGANLIKKDQSLSGTEPK